MSNFDSKIYSSLVSTDMGWLFNIMGRLVPLASTNVMVLLSITLLGILLHKKLFYLCFSYLVTMGGGVAITFIMKISIQRPRPNELVYLDFFGLTGDSLSHSYPSGHSVKGFLFLGFLSYVFFLYVKNKQLRLTLISMCILGSFFIGIGQIVSDRHFPSDIIGGYLIAIAWFTFTYLFNSPLYQMVNGYIPRSNMVQHEQI